MDSFAFLKRVGGKRGVAAFVGLAVILSFAIGEQTLMNAADSTVGKAEKALERPENPATGKETGREPEPAQAEQDAESAGGDASEKRDGTEEKPEEGKKVETAEEAAARVEAEHKERRKGDRRVLMERAEKFIETADETLLTSLPYPLNLLFGVRVFNTTLWRYLAGAGLMVLGLFIIYLVSWRFKKITRHFGESGANQRYPWLQAFDVAFLALRTPIKLLLFGLIIRSVSSLIVTPYHPDIVSLSNLLVFFAGVLYVYGLVGIIDRIYGDFIFHSSDKLMDTVRPMLLKLVRFFIILVAALHVYQDLTGRTMFSIIAGLGIGGLALALASQETLQNLLGFAAIAFDKSFLVGDAVTIAEYSGTVEHVGLRSTQLRGYDGNCIVIPNSTAVKSNIINLTRRPYVRKEIRIALSTINPYDKVNAAMEGIRDVVGEHQGKVAGLPPVVRFIDYEPSRFIIQVCFWYDSNQPFFFDECSRINLEICHKLSDLNILYAER